MKNHIIWSLKTLEKLDYGLISQIPEMIQQVPWSEVYRFETAQGDVYLKKTPADLAIESEVIELLANKFHVSVPTIIAKNTQEHCFLMKDAGISLRTYFKKQGLDQALFIRVLNNYADLQYNAIDSQQDFLNLGVSDWSIDKISGLYEQVCQEGKFFQQIGLTSVEMEKCHQLVSGFHLICKKLSHYKIPNTFNHCDFHDNNILIDEKTQKITLVDFGEVEVTHPFFSLLNALYQVKIHHQLNHNDYEKLKQEALKAWLKLESLSNLEGIMKLVEQGWFMHHVLGIYRIMTSVDPDAFQVLAQQGRFARKLRVFLER